MGRGGNPTGRVPHSTSLVQEEPRLESPRSPCGWPTATLRGFRAGDPAALREVYRLHVGDVTGLLRHGFSFESAGRAHRFVGYDSAFELQDALHETFRRAFEPAARQAFDGIRPYTPYLRMIARNVVLRTFRAQREMFPLADGDTAEPDAIVLVDTEPSAEHDALAREMQGIVRAFLDTLPAADRELLTLRFVEGLSQRDAADSLGLGRQQIRGREAKLRQALLDHLHLHDAGTTLGATWIAGPIAALIAEALR